MKILLLNQNWFAPELRSFGHDVLTCGLGPESDHRLIHPCHHINDLIGSLPGSFRPDVVIWHDDSAPVSFFGMEDLEVPTILYSVDTHHHWELHSRLAHCFDCVLVAQKDYLHHFAPSETPTFWFPLWAPRHVVPSSRKDMQLAFVGTMDPRLNHKRVEFFSTLQQLIPITIKQGNYWEVFPHSEIVINQTVSGDLNFRVFESMMCGCMLLTERSSNGLLELFHEGEHLVTYSAGDIRDVAEKSRELLECPQRMHAIAQAGRAEVLAKHTALHRASQLNDIIASLRQRPKQPSRHLPMMINHRVLGCLLEKRNPVLALSAIRAAVQCATAALREGCIPSHAESAHMIRTYLQLDKLTGQTLGSRLLVEHAAALPENYLLALARIRALLNQGRQLEAERLASAISSDTSPRVFELAEQAVSLLLQ